MELLFHAVCLLITLFVLQSYVSSRFSAREHRLLPLVLGLIALNNFYQIVFYVTRQWSTFRILEDLLTIQMLYLMIHYVGDFMKFRFTTRQETGLFCSLIVFDAVMIVRAAQQQTYQDAFRIALLCYVGILLGLATYVRFKIQVSAWEGRINDLLYLGMALPGIALVFRAFTPKAETYLIPAAFEISCLIVYYLMMTGQLSNVTTMMQENVYNISDIPTFLFDSKMRYRNSNRSAEQKFPDLVRELTEHPRKYSFYDKMVHWSKEPEKEHVTQAGTSYYQCLLYPVTTDRRRILGYLLLLPDITQQKQETVRMEQRKKKAETEAAFKSQFLASVSHDLRSPLHAILGGTDILSQQDLPKESQNILAYIRAAGNSLLEQVDTILAYSKLEAGMLTLKEKEYNFYEMIQELARVCLLNIQNKDITFTVVIKDTFPELVKGDAMRVTQILQNILSNACKYTEHGAITLTLHCTMEQEQVCFEGCVEDTGIGMTEEQTRQMFTEFVSFSDEVGVEGTGLGLSIVRQLSELMHGGVWAESELGKGTRIHVKFYQTFVPSPLLPPVTVGQELLKEQIDPQVDAVLPNFIYPTARVLLVDDMEVNRVIFQKLAAPWQFTLDLAASGSEAVALAKRQDYQLIVLDQMMPGMSGFETADQIKRYTDAPLVLMTADLSDEAKNESVRHGFSGFMPKPIRLDEMRQVLEDGIAAKYRENPDLPFLEGKTTQEIEGRMRTLESYVREVEGLLLDLPAYAAQDPRLFQTKVHGIKGISRQIGKEETAQQAEIMEMAAKTDNQAFIDRNLPAFLQELQHTVKTVQKEVARCQKEQKRADTTVRKTVSEQERKACWDALKSGFDTYDITKIEENLKLLSGYVLPPEEEKRLPQVRKAYEDLEYEMGSEACRF